MKTTQTLSPVPYILIYIAAALLAIGGVVYLLAPESTPSECVVALDAAESVLNDAAEAVMLLDDSPRFHQLMDNIAAERAVYLSSSADCRDQQ